MVRLLIFLILELKGWRLLLRVAVPRGNEGFPRGCRAHIIILEAVKAGTAAVFLDTLGSVSRLHILKLNVR